MSPQEGLCPGPLRSVVRPSPANSDHPISTSLFDTCSFQLLKEPVWNQFKDDHCTMASPHWQDSQAVEQNDVVKYAAGILQRSWRSCHV